MATINFLYRSSKPEAPLNLRFLFRHNEKDYVFGAKTKLQVSKYYWEKQHNLKRSKDIDISNRIVEVNSKMNNIEKHILAAFEKVMSPETINKEWLGVQMDHYYNPIQQSKNIPIDLVSFIDYYIEQRKDEITRASRIKFNVIKHKMERLQSSINKTIFIKDINQDFKDVFTEYYNSENYSQNTTQRELNIIKTFCKFAKSKGLEVHSELDSLKLKKGNTLKIFLTFEELKSIEDANLDKDYLINARDWLIISCYTGQRVSDFMRFNKEMIRLENDNEGNAKELIEFIQKKTNKKMTIPIHSKVKEVLNKRNGDFPRQISDQRYNEFIKKVCEAAEIKEPIEGKKQLNISKDPKISKIRNVEGVYPKCELVTSHIGRRSFATNFYGTIPTTLLINVTGHSTETMFLNYIGKSNKDLAMALTKYF
ncbi:MAG: phage integrase SAM-like domain-containing protein [Flavobacteriaceae bacterium]|nr:phage integrase SAM-like domain-containing protein [Flavobacteriaceae bacterium]